MSTDHSPLPPRRPLRRAGLRLLTALLLVAAPTLDGGPARAATTGSASLLMPQATGAESQFGDFISSSVTSTCGGCTAVPINTIYRYYIEVPSGLTRLRVQIFDPDIGIGGAAEADAQRDRSRAGAFNSSVKYTLLRPDGTTAATQTCAQTPTAFCVDNAWDSLLDTTTTPIQAGHWELDVDQSTAVDGAGNTDINAFGIRADDGSQADATELPIYYSAQNQIGQNPPSSHVAGTKSYTFYPYITSGCSFTEEDFDFDLNNGNAGQNVGSINFTSRIGTFTKNFASSALSGNDVWKSNGVTGWTTDSDATDYGIWTMKPSISNYFLDTTDTTTIQGNYANVYVASSSAAAPPPANNAPTANTFRVYFATDAGGTPVKPYMKQETRYVFLGGAGGPNPPVAGMTTINQITVQVVNPTANAITFSAANQVTVNVPGGGATYGGNAAVTQGTITAQPAVNGTGNVTWNPGTVAAGATALLTYQVKILPASAGQRIPVVGTVASGNGTTGKWVDETGNTTQARATFTHGPLCELAATAGVITPVVVSGVRARRGERGGVLVEWDTSSEVGTVGFDLLRWEPREGRYIQANRTLLPALLSAAQGGHYRFLDDSARDAGTQRFIVVEHVALRSRVEERPYGPFEVELASPGAADEIQGARRVELPPLPDSGFDRTPWLPTAPAVAVAAGAVSAAAPATASAESAGATTDGLSEAGADASLNASTVVRGNALAIGVRAPGIHFLAATDIAARLGFPLPIVQALISGGVFSLSNHNLDVAWVAADNPSGILFYGEAANSIYTTDNVYWLRPGLATRMRVISGTPPSPAAAASFRDTGHTEQETFAATVIATDPNSDYWFWDSLIAGDPTFGTKSFQLNATGVAPAGTSPARTGGSAASPAHLQVNLFGATASGVSGEHHAMVTLNGTPIGEDSWTGVTAHAVQLDFNQGLLHEGSNTVTIQAVLEPGVPYSIFYLAGFDVTYQRLYQAAGDALLVRGDANPVMTVGGFADSRILAFDVTDPRHPALDAAVTIGKSPAGAGSGFAISLAPAAAGTPYQTVSRTGAKSPVWLRTPNPVSLRAAGKGGDYLVVTTHDLLGAAQELTAYRAGQGLKATVVDIQDVYDQFSDGLTDPRALQSFLSFAHGSWPVPPRFVVLAGQGNLDYRNNLGFGGNLLPPLMAATAYGLFASDDLFVDPLGSGVPQVAIGRLPVASAADLHAQVQKIQQYESGAATSWSGQALLVADGSDGAASFAAESDQIASSLPSGYGAQRIYVDQLGAGPARSTLLSDLGSGAGLLSYVGHGGLDRLSASGLLLSTDAASLANGALLPVMSALTCTINRFELPGFQALGAALVQQPGGGAAAVWAPSGLSSDDAALLLGRRFFLQLGNAPALGLRLGEVVKNALTDFAAAGGTHDMLVIYQLLGDPGLMVKGVPTAASLGRSAGE